MRRCFCFFLLMLACALPLSARAQSGRIIDNNRVDETGAAPVQTPLHPGSVPRVDLPTVVAPPEAEKIHFHLTAVKIVGATVVSAETLKTAYAERIGKTVDGKDVSAIANAIADLYRAAGYDLFTVTMPRQNFAGGVLKLKIVEGYVRRVIVTGETEGADLSLLSAYGEKIADEKPLSRATFERYLLLIKDIRGRRVSDKLVPVPGEAGAVDLVLIVQRKTFELMSSFNNLGSTTLGRYQFTVGAAANSVLREGDRTQVNYSFPEDFYRFRYYAISHATPLGTDGTMLQGNFGYLKTRPESPNPTGEAYQSGLQVSHPLIRSLKENLSITGALDMLDSNNASLGNVISTEHTRAARGGLSYSRNDALLGMDRQGTSAASVVLSQGLDVFGAETTGSTPASSDFTKLNVRLGRDQQVMERMVARLKLSAQYAGSILPVSEQFTYGGTEFGRAFQASAMSGDRGINTAAELAYGLPQSLIFLPGINVAEIYAAVDQGTVWNSSGNVPLTVNHAASVTGGIRFKAFNRVFMDAAISKPIAGSQLSGTGDGLVFLFSLSAAEHEF